MFTVGVILIVWWLLNDPVQKKAEDLTGIKDKQLNNDIKPFILADEPIDKASYQGTEPAATFSQCHIEQFFEYQRTAAEELSDALLKEFSVFKVLVNQALTLRVYHRGEIDRAFLAKLVSRLKQVHRYYLSVLNDAVLHDVEVNLIIIGDRMSYEDLSSQTGFDPRMSQGVFFHGSNSAFIEYKGEAAALKTAIHEAVHAINLRLVGRMPRWLNEGLAEVFEHMTWVDNKADWRVNKHVYANMPMELYSVLESESQWGSIDTAILYFSGWAWVHYMMNSNSSDVALRQLIIEEHQDMCTMLSASEIALILEENHPTIEQSFYLWWETAASR